MAQGLNRVMMMGNLGGDPQMNYTPNGRAVTTFTIAVNEGPKEEVQWFKVVAWERLAETCNQYLKKGSFVFLEGRVRLKEWQDSNGKSRSNMEITAKYVKFLHIAGNEGSPNTGIQSSDPNPDIYEEADDSELPW